jgi:hypothetical protein
MAQRGAVISDVRRMKKWCISGHNVTELPHRRGYSTSSTDRSSSTGLAALKTRNE